MMHPNEADRTVYFVEQPLAAALALQERRWVRGLSTHEHTRILVSLPTGKGVETSENVRVWEEAILPNYDYTILGAEVIRLNNNEGA